MQTWYRLNLGRWPRTIEQIKQVVKETAHTIVFSEQTSFGSRIVTEKKQTTYSMLFNNFLDARFSAIEYQKAIIVSAQQKIDEANSEIAKLTHMTEDDTHD